MHEVRLRCETRVELYTVLDELKKIGYRIGNLRTLELSHGVTIIAGSYLVKAGGLLQNYNKREYDIPANSIFRNDVKKSLKNNLTNN